MFSDWQTFIIVGSAYCAAAAVLGFVFGWERAPRTGGTAQAERREPQHETIATPNADHAADVVLADLAVLVWKVNKAMRGSSPRVLERNVEKLLTRLKEHGLELNEYKGQRLSIGSRVTVLDKANGPEDLVLEDLEPEVIKGQRLLHEAVIIVGNGNQPPLS